MNSNPTLEKFLRAYLITALWSSVDEDQNPFDSNYSVDDFSSEQKEKARKDCSKFIEENTQILADAIATGNVIAGPDFDEYERAAHDFWLTRNGHGAGFWDGDWPEPFAEQLTQAAEKFGQSYVLKGDDGQIYIE